MAYVAAGRLDGYWEIGLEKWDLAAGILLIEEAGGLVTDFTGNDEYFHSGNLIVANLKLHKKILDSITPHLSDDLKK